MRKLNWLKPEWTPTMIAAMVIGFWAWWPLGLATLAYIIWGDQIGDIKADATRAANGALGDVWRRTSVPTARTGNVAFDDWRSKEIERLNEERRKLDDMRGEFDEYITELRKARDHDEFDRFMRERKASLDKPAATEVTSAS